MKSKIKLYSILCVLFCLFVSCKKTVWYNDLSKAQSAAKKQNKLIYIVFTGIEWNESSKNLNEIVLTNEAFTKEMLQNYVLVHYDFTEAEREANKLYKTLSDEEKKEYEQLKKQYDEKDRVAVYVGCKVLPTAYLITYEGYSLMSIMPPQNLEVKTYLESVERARQSSLDKIDIVNRVRTSKGREKLDAIYNLMSVTPDNFAQPHYPLITMFDKLDPDNESGLAGKFELKQAYLEAAMNKTVQEPSPFIKAIEKGHLSTEQIQEAYYMAAYYVSMHDPKNFDKMLEYLNLSFETDENSRHKSNINNAIEAVKKAKLAVEEKENEKNLEAEVETDSETDSADETETEE